MEKLNCLIYCNCGANIITEKKQRSLAESFLRLNIDVFELHDICAFSLNEKDFFKTIENKYNKKFIVACYPRAIENMFAQNNIELINYVVLNFRELSEEDIEKRIKLETEEISNNPKYEVLKSSLKVPAWYPIIDKHLCTLCGQCARFCVFGVYKYNKKNLDVVNPLACKNNCPACGRTCPTSAIIFPRLPESSILSGAKPDSEEKPVNPNQKGSLFVLLNERKNLRQNIFRDGIIQKAEVEKLKAIEEFKKGIEKK